MISLLPDSTPRRPGETGELAVYDIVSPVVGEKLSRTAPGCRCSGWMDYAGTGLQETGREVLRRLGEHLFDADEVDACPGSLMYGDGTLDRCLFRLDDVSLEVLTSSAENLFDWVWPRLPEDLHFLRADGSTVLGMVAQEGDAWHELTRLEYEGSLGGCRLDLGCVGAVSVDGWWGVDGAWGLGDRGGCCGGGCAGCVGSGFLDG